MDDRNDAPNPAISAEARQFAERYVMRRHGNALLRPQRAALAQPVQPVPVQPQPPRVPDRRPLAGPIMARRQVDLERAQYAETAPLLQSVKSSSFPDGQYEHIKSLDLKPGKEFKAYLAALGELEQLKKTVDPRKPTPPQEAATLRAHCLQLIASADAYLAHFEADLGKSEKADKSSQSKKRLCEEGLLSARQYLIALDFDAIGAPPTGDQPWDEATRLRAANVRAKVAFHQGFQAAATLKDGGDAQGQSESRWVNRGDLQSVADGQGGRQWQTSYRKDAIFKPMIGEKAPDGSTDRPGAGAAKEALASGNARRFGVMTGIDLGVPETSVVALNRYALKGGGPVEAFDGKSKRPAPRSSDEVVGSVQANAGAKDQLDAISFAVRDRIPKADIHKIALLDLMSLSVDRHDANLMVRFDERTGEPGMVPIDHGGTLPSRYDFSSVKNRFAGVSYGFDATVVNALMTTPTAFEPMEQEMQDQLALLRPDDLEAGMKAQRGALDAVHPALGAGEKVGDDSFHMSRRTMMFTQLAASQLSPAAIQIAIHQHGEDLFDVDDAGFGALAQQVIAEQVPKSAGYEEFFLGPVNEWDTILKWLEKNGWTLPSGTSQGGGSDAFLMKDPVLALKLFKSKTPNPAPFVFAGLPKVVPADPAEGAVPPPKSWRDKFARDYPEFTSDVKEATWTNRVPVMAQIDALGGATLYRTLLAALGAAPCSGPGQLLTALTRWNAFDPAQKNALLNPPVRHGGNTALDLLLTRVAEHKSARAQADAAMATAVQFGATVDGRAAIRNSFNDSLARSGALLDDMQAVADVTAFRSRMQVLLQTTWRRDPVLAENQAVLLEREVYRSGLDVVAGQATALKERLVAADRFGEDATDHFKNCLAACFNTKNLALAKIALQRLRDAGVADGVV